MCHKISVCYLNSVINLLLFRPRRKRELEPYQFYYAKKFPSKRKHGIYFHQFVLITRQQAQKYQITCVIEIRGLNVHTVPSRRLPDTRNCILIAHGKRTDTRYKQRDETPAGNLWRFPCRPLDRLTESLTLARTKSSSIGTQWR